MTTFCIRGVGVDVTESMASSAKKSMAKLFGRFPPVSHEIFVKKTVDGVEITANYHVGKSHKTASVTSDDFYAGVNSLRDNLLRQCERDASLRAVTRGRRPHSAGEDVETEAEDAI